MKIIIAGDFCPWDRVATALEQQDYTCLNLFKPLIQKADYSIVNLECPIVGTNMKPIEKSGPSLFSSQRAIDALKENGVKAVSLANNHFRDYGDVGIRKTIELLSQYGIDYVGGGENINEASKILFKEIEGKKIAIISCCESECSIASDIRGGSNPINPMQQYYRIKEAKASADMVIVIVHGGIEYYQFPTPRMKELYRFYIDVGADVVINHHQHCYGGYEIYQNKPIFYGLGNFCFDWPNVRHSKFNEGYLVELDIVDKIKFKLYPFVQCDEEPVVRPMSSDELVKFNQSLLTINSTISDDSLLCKEFERLTDKKTLQYQLYLEPYHTKLTRFLFRKKILPKLMKKKYRTISNVVRCESHRECLLNAIK